MCDKYFHRFRPILPALAVCLAAAAPLMAPSPVAAGEAGWYVGGGMPLMFNDDTESTTSGTMNLGQTALGYTADARTEYDTGFKFSGMAGYDMGNGVRVEAELFYATAKVSKLSYSNVTYDASLLGAGRVPGAADVPVSGSAKQLGGMISLWYDIDMGSTWIPYVGGGLGFVRIDQGDVKFDANGAANHVAAALRAGGAPIPPQLPGLPDVSATDTAMAWQIGLGVGYRLNERAVLNLGYRLQETGDLEFDGKNAVGAVAADTDQRTHFFEVGVRYGF